MKRKETIRLMAGGAFAAVALTLLIAGCSKGDHDAMTPEGDGEPKPEAAAETTAALAAGDVTPYPLDFCVVSDEKLGSMGKPYAITYEGREIKFCCDGCEEDFRKEPAKFLAKIDAAAKEKG